MASTNSILLATTSMGHFIGGQWMSGGMSSFEPTDPATGEILWSGCAAGAEEVDAAIAAARAVFEPWANLPLEGRINHLRSFARILQDNRDHLARTISMETGKPLWESREEVGAMINKVELSIQAYRERCAPKTISLSPAAQTAPASSPPSAPSATTRYKPHGVVAVFGPFNFPGHLPNGHIVPALLAGNTVVFKPSELTPLSAQHTIELWTASGLPAGVLNLVQGGRETGKLMIQHPELDGLFFTGSFAAGQTLARALAPAPQKILALEMGGNNPLVVWPPVDPAAAAVAIVQSAYLTAGQRCSCARRLIVPAGGEGDRVLDSLMELIPRLRIGPFTDDPEPFMGPVINGAAADRLLAVQQDLRHRGGEILVEMTRAGPSAAFLTPGLMDVTAIADPDDVEHFGPFLQVRRVGSFDDAITEANKTAYGLVAGLLCDDPNLYQQFYRKARAGLINWNRPTTGASSRLPFGGIGQSGNHRPSAYFAADYCSYPVASIEAGRLVVPEKLPPGVG